MEGPVKKFASKLKNKTLENALDAWHGLFVFEENIARLQSDVSPGLEASLSKKPGDRSARDLERLMPLIRGIKAYSALQEPVIELIARYCKLDVLIESQEIPRTSDRRDKVYSVISGKVKAISGDWSDPQMMVLARTAADELMSIENVQKEMTAAEDVNLASLPYESLVSIGSQSMAQSKFETLIKLGLGPKYHEKRVRKRIWRQMIEVAHSGGIPSRQKALLMLEELGLSDMTIEGEKRSSSFSSASLLEIEPGQSFSGWDTDCRAEGGTKLESVVQLPPRIQGAVTEQNALAALIYVTKGVYRRAIQMQLDLMVQREVDACCRLPFLRHTGLKELFDLAKHLQVVTFSKGDVLLSQGKEALKSPVYFLLEGEVELCVDLPLTHDPQEISNALALLLGNTSSSHLKLKAQAILSGSASRGVQRVVLGKRSGGVILGDEALREDRVMMTVVAAGNAKALSVPSSRFSSSLDPLTQRLFQKPRTQRSTATFVSSMTASGASEARSLLERCRSEILSLTYEGIRGRPPVTLDHSPVKVLKTWINAGDSHISPIKVKASTDFDMTPEASIHPPTTGLTVSRFSQVTQSNSMASFVSSVKELEDQRMVDAIALMNRSKTIDPALDALGLSRRLDLTSIVDRGSSHGRYTELYEAGCLAILRVEEKPGQGLRPALSFALCMDEVIAAWQEIAHSGDLQIVRWSCHEFYLIGRPLFISNLGANDPNNTYIIRTMADSILSMVAVFEKIVGRSEVNLFRTVSAITLGPLFVAFDCGRFVVGLSGQAFDAASALCHQALKEKSSALSSTILISDGVMMSISRTHDCVLTGSTYQLLGPTVLPHGTSFKDLFKAQGGKPSRSYHYCNGGSLHCPIDDGLGGSSLESLSMPFSNMTPRSALIPEAISRPDPLTHKPFDASKVKSLWGKGGSPRPSTLEPRLSLTKSSSLFQKASSTTAMSARQQLRKEIEDIRKSQGQDKIIVAEVSELAPSPPASKTPQWKDCGASRALSEFIIELDDSLNSLSLSTSGLKIFPDLSRLRYLQSLAASFNQFGLHLNTIPVPRASPLSSLPSSLRTLSLSHNGISQLPDEFGSCLPLLVDLNLSNNCLSSIPFSLSMLTCLQALSLQHNRLKSMDEACINALCGLTALYLGYNELSSIGESANSLSGLTSLETLDVSMNALEFLPPTLSHLPSLKCLLASHNLLETLPDGFLSTQAHLTHLDLQGNCLCHCPQLTGLDEFLLDALNNKYSDDPDGLEDIDEDSPPPILADSFSTTFAGSFSSVMMSGPSAYGRAPSLFRSKSMARAPSMKRIGSRRGGPSTLAYTPTPEPHLDVDVQCLTPCQLASSAAQAPSVVKLPHLLVLDLSSNGLLALPPWLPPSLQSLSASNNRLESVHAWLAERLTGLHCLDLQSNRITHLSRSLSQLSVISCVCLADNPCSDVDAATAGGAEMAGWLEEHVIKLKYNKKVQSELQLNREA